MFNLLARFCTGFKEYLDEAPNHYFQRHFYSSHCGLNFSADVRISVSNCLSFSIRCSFSSYKIKKFSKILNISNATVLLIRNRVTISLPQMQWNHP